MTTHVRWTMDSVVLILCVFFAVYLMSAAEGHPYPCYARDCRDVMEMGFKASGVYHIYPGDVSTGFDVYCDLTTDSRQWLVFQRRIDGSVDFNRTWDEYVVGFGDVSGEHWLGNQILKLILSQGQYLLRIEVKVPNINVTMNYGIFNIGNYADNYKLSIGVGSGVIAPDLLYHDGAEFSARDKENNPSNCSAKHTGGWWFKDCLTVNLNGIYGGGNTKGMLWEYSGSQFLLTGTEMKIARL